MKAAAARTPRGLLRFYLDLDWLVVVALSWLVPLMLFNRWGATYLLSETFFLIPVLALLPRFFHEAPPGSRRRRAFYWATGFILAGGSVLDLVFGKDILTFGSAHYCGYFMGIPYEEFIFYLLGPVAMLLVYFWADSHFLKATSPENQRLRMGMDRFLLQASLPIASAGVVLAVLGTGLKAHWAPGTGFWPEYYLFLLAGVFLPTSLFFRAVKDLVNWQALTLTVLYLLVTSIIWEPTLGVPLEWWGYQPGAMLGLWVDAWNQSLHIHLPIEAVLLWLAVPFTCIFFFEIVSAHHYHPARNWKDKYFSRKLGWRGSFRLRSK